MLVFWRLMLIKIFVTQRVELLFVLLFAYLRRFQTAKLQKAGKVAALHARHALPVVIK